MQRMYCCYSISILVATTVFSWEFAATSPFAPREAVHDQQDKGHSLQSSQHVFHANERHENMDDHQEVKEKASKRLSTPGSKPPKCEHKCRGCKPCTAVQVPNNSDHLLVEYANYEPEGWACKCGSSFFIP